MTLSDINDQIRDADATALTRFNAMSDRTLLLAAAEVLSHEPTLKKGSFRSALGYREIQVLSKFDLNFDPNQPCHCLVGSIKEAAGVYWFPPGYVNLLDVWTLHNTDSALERRQRHGDLDQLIASHIDVDDVLESPLFSGANLDSSRRQEARNQLLGSPDGLIFNYSDYVLSPLGPRGIRKAITLLKAAAMDASGTVPVAVEA